MGAVLREMRREWGEGLLFFHKAAHAASASPEVMVMDS